MAKHHSKKMCPCPPDPLDRARGILRMARTCDEKQAAAGYIESQLNAKAGMIPDRRARPSSPETMREHFVRTKALPELERLRASVGRSCGTVANDRFVKARGGLFGLGILGL